MRPLVIRVQLQRPPEVVLRLGLVGQQGTQVVVGTWVVWVQAVGSKDIRRSKVTLILLIVGKVKGDSQSSTLWCRRSWS